MKEEREREGGSWSKGQRREDLLLQCEECKADVGYYLSLPAMASSPRLEVDYCFGELDGHITYVLKEQDKEANLFKPEGVCEGSKREIVVPNIYIGCQFLQLYCV